MLETEGVNYIQDYEGYSTLHLACRNGRINIAEYILKRGGNVNSMNFKSCTPLMYACVKGHLEIVRLLIKNGADVNLSNLSRYAPLMYAADRGRLDIIKELMLYGVDINYLDERGNSALFFASKSGRFECVEYLLEQGAMVNHSGTPVTPLVFTCTTGHIKIVKLLVDNGAYLNGLNNSKTLPMLAACENGYLNIVKYLIEKGCNYLNRDKTNRSALHIAVFKEINQHIELIKFLLEYFDVDDRDDNQNTPLIFAARIGREKNVRCLIDCGADVFAQNIDGETAMDIAKIKGHVGVVKYLEEKIGELRFAKYSEEKPDD